MGSVTFAKSVIALTMWHEMITLSSNSGRKGCWKLFPSHLVLFVWGTDRIWPILNQLAIMRTSAGCSMGPRLGHEFSVNRITLIIMGARWGEKWSSFEKNIRITRRIQIQFRLFRLRPPAVSRVSPIIKGAACGKRWKNTEKLLHADSNSYMPACR